MAIETAPQTVEFTYQGYTSLLRELLRNGYRFESFEQTQALLERSERFVLMRHDIDFDLEKAAAMARLENREGVRATYFFMLRTEHYNLLSREGTALVREILGLGHYLGLHFDCASYPEFTQVEQFARACRLEAEILESWFEKKVQIVSYHRPAPNVLAGAPGLSAPYDNTYLPLYTRQVQYCSDSRGEWKHGTPLQTDGFAHGRPLHILIHPIWWCNELTAARPVLNRLLEDKQLAFRKSFAENCTIFGK